MKPKRVFLIGGFDPSGHSGVLRDSFAGRITSTPYCTVVTAITYQSFSYLDGVAWLPLHMILNQLSTLLKEYEPTGIKIGVIRHFQWITHILLQVKKHISRIIPVVVDPVIASSSGYPFHKEQKIQINFTYDPSYFDVYLTPNLQEAMLLTGDLQPDMAASRLSSFAKVILKGGHGTNTTLKDKLFIGGELKKVVSYKKIDNPAVRGRGCLYASLLTCFLSKGQDIASAMENAVRKMEMVLLHKRPPL